MKNVLLNFAIWPSKVIPLNTKHKGYHKPGGGLGGDMSLHPPHGTRLTAPQKGQVCAYWQTPFRFFLWQSSMIGFIFYVEEYLRSLMNGFVFLSVQCDAIRSEQFENGHFLWAYNLRTKRYTSSEQIIIFARHKYGRVGYLELRWDH